MAPITPAASISQTIAAIRRQRIPVHTIGFGREHPDHDVEMTDAVVPPRALPQSRLTAVVTLQSYGLSGSKARLDRARQRQGAGVAGGHAEGRWPAADGIAGVQRAATPGPKTLEIARRAARRAKRTRRTTRSPALVNVENAQAAHPLLRRRAALGVQVHPARAGRLSGPGDRAGDHAAHHAEQDSPPVPAGMNEHDLEDGFPPKAEELFAVPGSDHRQRGGQLLHRPRSSS